MITYGSVCSGIESASVAWEPLGLTPSWFSEIEPFPCSLLAHHYPNVVNLGDMNVLPSLIASNLIDAPDILVGGTPCQAFSVAGKGESLDDERGQLTMKYVEVLNEIDKQRPGDECVAVWENVPGVLSTKDNAFGCFLGALSGSECELQPTGKKWTNSGCVFGPQRAIAWRVIDAQYFGVAQRRRRVFLVASARKGFNPAKVLFESEGVRRDIKPSREAREEVTGTVTAGVRNADRVDNLVVVTQDPAYCLQTTFNDYSRADNFNMVVHGTQDPCVQSELAFTLGRNNGGENCMLSGSSVRRLMPVEGERLQGFPDNYTNIPHNGKPAYDGPRYKAIGNSKAVPCIKWLGIRLLMELCG